MRAPVDVVVPFLGDAATLGCAIRRMSAIELRSGDSITVVDNTPGQGLAEAPPEAAVRVVGASERQTPGFARNRGAHEGSAAWLVFLDADTAPSPDLLDRYFDPPPGPRTGLIGGGVLDQVVPADAPFASRYAYLRGAMSQGDTFSFGEWGYPKSANIACRRSAFEQIGGFRESIRAAEDADLTYRLRAAGWEVERREAASVVHFSRPTVTGLLAQKARWGAGGAWLARQYPGSVALVRGPGLAWWALRSTVRELLSAVRRRDRDAAIFAILHPLEAIAWQLGRLLSNERQPGATGQR